MYNANIWIIIRPVLCYLTVGFYNTIFILLLSESGTQESFPARDTQMSPEDASGGTDEGMRRVTVNILAITARTKHVSFKTVYFSV